MRSFAAVILDFCQVVLTLLSPVPSPDPEGPLIPTMGVSRVRHPKGKHGLPLAFNCMGRDWRMKIRLLFSIPNLRRCRCVILLGTTNQVCWECNYCVCNTGYYSCPQTEAPENCLAGTEGNGDCVSGRGTSRKLNKGRSWTS